MSDRCPLDLQKQTSAERVGMSVLGHKRTSRRRPGDRKVRHRPRYRGVLPFVMRARDPHWRVRWQSTSQGGNSLSSRIRVTTANPVPNKRIKFRTIASNTGPGSVAEPLIEASISPVASCHARASLRSRVRRAVSVSSVIVADRQPDTALGRMERHGVVALRRPVFAPLPPAFERRFIALPRPVQGIVAGQTSLLEVTSQCCRLDPSTSALVKSGHGDNTAGCPLYPRERTLMERAEMSALGQKRPRALQQFVSVN
jgi:hypothetical protein